MLRHSFDALPWDRGALPGGLPFCDDDEDMQMILDANGQDVNNRVGGGAGKRLSLPELQVRSLLSIVAICHTCNLQVTICTLLCMRGHCMFKVCPCIAQAQFGVGLREAAANLRICPTTLKRACRRHGITRWPRRQLARLNREGSSRSEGSGDTLRTEWGAPSGALSSGQPGSMPTSSGTAALPCLHGHILPAQCNQRSWKILASQMASVCQTSCSV